MSSSFKQGTHKGLGLGLRVLGNVTVIFQAFQELTGKGRKPTAPVAKRSCLPIWVKLTQTIQ